MTFTDTASEEHRCSKLCHHGPCGTCDKKTLLKCRCRATDKVCTVHVGVYVWVYKHCFVEMINKWSSSIHFINNVCFIQMALWCFCTGNPMCWKEFRRFVKTVNWFVSNNPLSHHHRKGFFLVIHRKCRFHIMYLDYVCLVFVFYHPLCPRGTVLINLYNVL